MASLLLYATILFLLVSTDITFSQTIIETLPGFPGKLPFKFETGYVGVGESENSQIFYYFIESERNPKDDPLVLFLTGGPGCSGLFTILYEIGPFTFEKTISDDSIPTVKLKPYSWTKEVNLLVIDQPVGTGFSYGKTREAYITNDTQASELTYQFLKKWLMIHPTYLKNKLYIGGISYAGTFVPLVTQKIYNGNDVEGDNVVPLNIQGYIMSNPVTDKFSDTNNRVKYAYRMGLLSDTLYKSVKLNCKENYVIVDPNNVLCQNDLQRVTECLNKVCYADILYPNCNFWSMDRKTLLLPSEKDTPPSVPQCSRVDRYTNSCIWANNKTVQKALHIRNGTITDWVRCNMDMSYNSRRKSKGIYTFDVRTTVPIHQNLTKRRVRALVFSGDHDLVIPHIATEEWINSLRLNVESDWRPWFVEGEVAGYTVKSSHLDYELTYATLKGGSHIATESKPEECFSMITRWLAGDPL